MFFRKFKLEGGELSPIFQDRGVNFFYLNCDHFCIVATSGNNASPAMVQTILYQIRNVLGDLIGVLDEKSLRNNFSVVYEVVDEMLDFGNP